MNDYYTTSEIANLMEVSRVTVFRWIREGKLKAIKPGRDYIVPFSSLPTGLQVAIQNKFDSDSPDEDHEKDIREAVKKAVKECGSSPTR